ALELPVSARSRSSAVVGDYHKSEHPHEPLGGVRLAAIGFPSVRSDRACGATALLDPAVPDDVPAARRRLAGLEKPRELRQHAADDDEITSRGADLRSGTPPTLGVDRVRRRPAHHDLSPSEPGAAEWSRHHT